MEYEAFREDYIKRHPASVPVLQFSDVGEYPRWVRWIVFAMFLSAAILSGVHTVPTVYDTIQADKVNEVVRQLAALLSFIAVETSTLLASYMLFKKWSWLVAAVLGIAITVATVANLYSVSKALVAQETGIQIVAATLGLGMPFMAILAGKLYVNLHNADRREAYNAHQQYAQDCIAFDAKIQAAWTRARGGQVLSDVKANSLNIKFNGHRSIKRASPGLDRVAAWLNDHPEQINMPVRELAELIGDVSYGTVHAAIRRMREMN